MIEQLPCTYYVHDIDRKAIYLWEESENGLSDDR